jgi:hypothetical protein
MKQSTKLCLLLGLTLLPYCSSEAATTTYACERNTRIARSKVASAGRSCNRLIGTVQRYKTEVVSRKAALTKRIEAQITTANVVRKKYLAEYLKLSIDALEKRYNGENGLVAKGQIRVTQGCKKASDASDALKKIVDSCPVIAVPLPTPTPRPA